MASASSSLQLFTTTPITSAVDSLVLFLTQSTLYSHSTSTLTLSALNSTSLNQFKANFTPDNVMVNVNTANDDPSNNDTSHPSTSPTASESGTSGIPSHVHLTNQLNHLNHYNTFNNLTNLTTFHDAIQSVQSEYLNASSPLVNSTTEFTPSNTSDTLRMVILSIVLGFLILATALGNICVILAIRSDRNLRSPQNLLIYSLAIADLLVSIVVMPFAAVYEISGSWSMGGFLCNLWTSADVLCCTSSILHLVAIALDRYWAVTNIDYSHSRTPYKIRISIFCVWIASIIVSIVPHFGLKDPEFDNRIANKECLLSQDVSYQLVAMALSFYIPLAFILFLYSKIFKVARKRIRNKPGNHAVVKPATNKPVPINITHSPISNINKDTSKEPVGISSHHSTNPISSLTSQLPMKVSCSVVEITPESLKQVNERNKSENMEMLQAIALAEKFDQATSAIGENQLTKEHHRQQCNLWPSIDVTLEEGEVERVKEREKEEEQEEEGKRIRTRITQGEETQGEKGGKRRKKDEANGNEGVVVVKETGSRSNKKHDSNKTTSVVQVESVALSEEHNRERGSNSRSSHQLSPANAQVEHLLEVASDLPDVTNAANEAGSATVTASGGNITRLGVVGGAVGGAGSSSSSSGNSTRGDPVEYKKEGTIRKSSSKFVRGYRMHNERAVDERCEQLHHENTASIASPSSNLHSLIHQAQQQTRNELTKNQPFVCSSSSAQDSQSLWRNNSIQGPILEEKSSSDLSSTLFVNQLYASSFEEQGTKRQSTTDYATNSDTGKVERSSTRSSTVHTSSSSNLTWSSPPAVSSTSDATAATDGTSTPTAIPIAFTDDFKCKSRSNFGIASGSTGTTFHTLFVDGESEDEPLHPLGTKRHLAKSLGGKETAHGFRAIEGRETPAQSQSPAPSSYLTHSASVLPPHPSSLSSCTLSSLSTLATALDTHPVVHGSDDARHNHNLQRASMCNVANRDSSSSSSSAPSSALAPPKSATGHAKNMTRVIGEASDESGIERDNNAQRGHTLCLSTGQQIGKSKNNRDSIHKDNHKEAYQDNEKDDEDDVDPSLVKSSGKDKVTKGPAASLKEQSSDTVKTAQVNHSAKSNRKVKGPLTTMSTISTTTTTATTKSELTTVAISTSVSISSASAQPALAALKSAKEARKEKERKTAKTLAIITGVFIVCWLPFFVMTFFMALFADPSSNAVPKILFSVFQWLGWVNSLLNPVIYTIFSPDFRNAFKKMLIYNRTGPNSRSSYYIRSARSKVNTGTGQSSNKLHAVPAITADPVTQCPRLLAGGDRGKSNDRAGEKQVHLTSKQQKGHPRQLDSRCNLRQLPIEEKSLQSVSLTVSRQEQSPSPSLKQQVSSSRESQSSNSPPAVETNHSNDFTSSNRTQTPSSSMSAYL